MGALVLGAFAGGCASEGAAADGSVDAASPTDEGSPAPPDSAGSPDATEADAGPSPPPEPFEMPPAPICPGATTGTGWVWLDDWDDTSLVERSLPCLAGDGTLSGPAVLAIEPDAWPAVQEPDHVFEYEASGPGYYDVQAYWGVVGMLGYYQSAVLVEIPPVTVVLLAAESSGVARYWRDDRRIELGLSGLSHGMLGVRIANHEYGHHLVMMHAPIVDQLTNEAVADYLSASFRGLPGVLLFEELELPPEISGNAGLLQMAGAYFTRSLDNTLLYPDDRIDWGEFCDVMKLAAGFASGMIPADRLERCDAMSHAERAEPEPHLTGRILGGALWDVRGALGREVTDRLVFNALLRLAPDDDFLAFGVRLAEAAAHLEGDSAAQAVDTAFAARGLLP